jgi:hypothetical protein
VYTNISKIFESQNADYVNVSLILDKHQISSSILTVNFNNFVFTVTFWESTLQIIRAERGVINTGQRTKVKYVDIKVRWKEKKEK